MPALTYPDVEQVVGDYLRPLIVADHATAFVGNVLPNPRPDVAVIVRDDGGPWLGDVRATSRLGLTVYVTDAYAESLESTARAIAADLGIELVRLIGGIADTAAVPGIVHSVPNRPSRIADADGATIYVTATLRVRGTN